MNKLVLLDGSCGSALWNIAERSNVPRTSVWQYNLSHPEMVQELYRAYISAGADMVQTNTFCVNRTSVEKESDVPAGTIIKAAVEIAETAVQGTQVKPYLSVGPLPVLLEPYGKLKYDECREIYAEIFNAAKGSCISMIMLETFMDLKMMKIAAEEAFVCGVPVNCSMTFGKFRRTMMGDKIADICSELETLKVNSVGMNCSFGPADGLKIIREFREHTDLPLYFKPNSGVGEEYGPESFTEEIAPALEFVTYVGGCCGTDENYISALRKKIDSL